MDKTNEVKLSDMTSSLINKCKAKAELTEDLLRVGRNLMTYIQEYQSIKNKITTNKLIDPDLEEILVYIRSFLIENSYTKEECISSYEEQIENDIRLSPEAKDYLIRQHKLSSQGIISLELAPNFGMGRHSIKEKKEEEPYEHLEYDPSQDQELSKEEKE
ncbi:MAG TPA: hypothetical protein VHA52_10125 [Candidatus Babeliaceae bacterium]|nr:hypothetical protein [Candidatus Babeliaceae bacterium]